MNKMAPEKPKITVLMPVYNGEKYLEEAIESILDQTFTDFEFLIINDGSTDRSVEMIESYNDPRIRLVHNKTNMKLTATLNRGLRLARGEYIARMDCDDISLPERFEKQLSFLEANPEVGIIGSGFKIIDQNGISVNAPVLFPSRPGVVEWCLYFYSPISHPAAMMRKEVVLRTGGYTSEVIYGREKYSGEDYDLWRRSCKVTKLSNLQDVMLLLRKHDTNVTKTYLDEHLINTAKISRVMMSECLGESLTIEIVQKIQRGNINKVNDIIPAGKVIYKLYRFFISSNKLSFFEKKLIRKDAVDRLLLIAGGSIRHVHAWYVMVLAFRTDPIYSSKKVLNRAYQKIRLSNFSLGPRT
jgi:glycosyltransferase involved in cell wall biosynthesis